MVKYDIQFMIECCIPTRSDGVGAVEMTKTGTMDFVPFPGLLMCVDEKDDPLTVEQVFYNMGGNGGFDVWFEAETNEEHGLEALKKAGWTEAQAPMDIPDSAVALRLGRFVGCNDMRLYVPVELDRFSSDISGLATVAARIDDAIPQREVSEECK